MANYISSTRTNYFHVTDMKAFDGIMSMCAAEDNIEVWKEKDELGEDVVAFGCGSTFDGLFADPDSEPDEDGEYEEIDFENQFDEFIKHLQPIIRPDDACIIFNAGWEKLRYVGGSATIITNKGCDTVSLTDAAIEKTRELLDDPAWNTETDE